MTITVSIDDTTLAELLAMVEAGEEIVIVRDGMPVAKMAAVVADGEKRMEAIEAIRAFRKTMPAITQEEIAEWKATGRR
ncbi:type II toxin-antitoxin system Phd/YefM family antitoxin [Rhizobium sp. RAF36]|uniref:type II toxin-antitoxin system Phd/YefM family antitoxin n=1 Tax=Rhizobium sp. RAF36 TaxID=3233055 RepID=UPI000DDB37F3